jgi:Zn-dependent protease with chaperone function
MTTPPASTSDQRCPQCGAALPVVPHVVTWCDHCEWNVNPSPPPPPQSPFERIYAALGTRLSRQLFAAVQQHAALRPPRTLSTALATVSALAVHGFTLLVALGGVALVLWAWPNPAPVVVGLLGLLVAWFGCPRVPTLPKDEQLLTRAQAPTLFGLLDQTSAALGARPLAHVVVDEHFNASYGEVGWRREPVLTLGLPLVAVLDAAELVALVGHELAHGVNGDPTRGLVVGSAVRSLCQYYWLMLPPQGIGLAGWLASGAMRLIALLPQGVLLGLSHLLWRSSQRAEYYADRLAARVAGRAGVQGLLAKLHCQTSFDTAVQQAAVRRDVPDLFAALQQRLAALPARERERIRRAELRDGARLTSTHPPTAFRLAMLETYGAADTLVSLSLQARAAIDDELRPLRAPLQRRLVEQYRDQIS